MNANESDEDIVFDPLTLRLVVGALAFAFPTVVIALTGKVTTSISASYHEIQTRDVFVGFTFIIGALLICYKGHLQGEPRQPGESVWSWFISRRWARVYQEDLISTIGGLAAIFTALYPTARDGDPRDTKAVVHTIGAFILFANVAYFCLIAFLRSLNQKLIKDDKINANGDLQKLWEKMRDEKMQRDASPFRKVWDFLTLEIQTFLAIAKAVFHRQTGQNVLQNVWKLLCEYDKKFSRGYTYVISGCVIALTLVGFLALIVIRPGWVEGTVTTFIVETIALVFFGISWITASQMKYVSQVIDWVKARLGKATTSPEPV